MPIEPGTREQVGKQARLWLLSLVCATVGAIAVYQTGALLPGIGAFFSALVLLGLPLWVFERARNRRRP